MIMENQNLTKSQKAFFLGKNFVEAKNIICYNNTFYKFDGCIWKKKGNQEIQSLIASEYINTFEPTETKQIKEVIRVICDQTIEMYSDSIHKINFLNKKNEINLKDYILCLDTMEKREYTKHDFAFSKLPFNYKESEKLSLNKFQNFLLSVFSYDKKTKLEEHESDEFYKTMYFVQEFMGYSLIKRNPFEKFLIMVGDGRNGKGTLIHIWSKMLGKENVSYVDIKGINNEQKIILTKNKLVNFSTDLEDGQQIDTGVVKAAVSGETVSAKELYKDTYEFEFSAKMIIATNELPYIRNVSPAIKERMIILPFNRVFNESERDTTLKQRLEEEIEDIFSWSVVGLKRLIERGRFDVPEMCKRELDIYLLESDSVQMWLSEENLIDEKSSCQRKTAYQHFKKHCQESGRKSMSKPNFFKRMRKLGFIEKKNNGYDMFEGLKTPYELSI